MEASKCITTRRSIRDFLNKEISDEVLEQIVSVAAYAPSWKNTQTCRYVVIKNRDMMNELSEKAMFGFAHNSSIVKRASALVVVAQKKEICGYDMDGTFSTPKGDRWQMFDAGVASQTFCLAAWDAGIGSVIMGIFDDEVVSRIVGLYKFESAAALIAIGYPAEAPEAPQRKPVDTLLKVVKENKKIYE